MNRYHRITLSIVLLLIRTASTCQPVSEFDNRNVTTTNSSHLIGYQLRPCPALYRLSNIIDAQLSNSASPTSQSTVLTFTDLLSKRCLQQNATPCSVDIPLQGLSVQGVPTALNVRVNYTCQLADPGWPEETLSSNTKEVSASSYVRYIQVKLVSFGRMDWNCTISSSRGSAVTGNWWWKYCVGTAFECLSWNRTVVASPIEGSSQFCLEPQTIGRIFFATDLFCGVSSESIAIDLQVPLDSDFDIDCSEQTPPQSIDSNQMDRMRADCSQLTWTSTQTQPSTYPPTSVTSPTSPSTSPTKGTIQGTRDTEASAGVMVTDNQIIHTTPFANKDLSSLGLGLGIALGLLVVLIVVIVIAVTCVRRKTSHFDAKTSKLAKPKTMEKDGGFVPANDVFTVHNIYSEIRDVSDMQPSPRPETTESTPPAVTSQPPGDRQPPKRPSSLSRKLFKQIAKLAKQEELQLKGPVAGDASGQPQGGGSSAVVESQTSLVDRWLYSSNLNSAENTLNRNSNNDGNGMYINRRFEMDV